jgi:hypothetical protein
MYWIYKELNNFYKRSSRKYLRALGKLYGIKLGFFETKKHFRKKLESLFIPKREESLGQRI